MAENSWQIGLIGSLNESESVTKINSDINKVNKQLGTLKLNTEINQSSISELEKQLKTLNIQLSNVTINKDVINNLVNQINEGLKNINIANININNVSNQAQQLGQQIGQEVSSGVNSIIQKNEFEKVFNFSQSDRNNIATKARDYFKQLSNGIVTVKEEMKELDGNTSLNAFTINIKNAKGEVESLRYALKNIIDDNGNVTGQQFQYTGGSINDVNAVKQFEQLNKVITDYQIKLNDLKTKYSNANVDYSEFETVFDNFKQGIGTVNDLSLAFNNLKNNAEKGIQGLKSQSSSFDPIQQALNNMRDLPSMLQSLQANMDGLKDKSALAGISVNDLAQTYEKLKGNIDQSGGKVPLTEKWTSDYQNLMSTIVAVTKQVEALKKAEMSDNSSAKISENALLIQEKIDIGSYDLQISNLETKFKKLGLSEDEVAEKTKNVKNALASMKESGIGQQELINREELFNTELTTTSNQLKIMTNEMSMFMSSTQQVNLTTRIQKWLDTNTAATRKARQELQSYLTELNSGQVTKIRGNEIKANFAQVDAQMRSIGKLGNSFFKTIGDGMKKFSYWTSSTYIVMKTIHSIKQSVSTVSELDTALVDLKKTTSMTSSQLNEFYYTANDIAKQMGVTTQEIINQTSAWSRLGYSSQEAATKMAKYSSMFASISPGMDVDTATDGLVSIMKAFDIGNNNPDDVLDGIMSKINIIGNTAATSNAEIVNMLSKSSSAMKEANNTLEETIALETAAVEITRDDDSVGTAFKTIAMRIRGYDEETESYTNDVEELSGAIADLTKTASTPGGISLFTNASKTEFKSTYQLLKEISTIYDDLDDKTQAQLLEKLAGKRQGQIIAATINNFSSAEKAMNNMAHSAGNAESEMSIIVDSIDYKLNKLHETGTGIAQNLFQREDMKSVIDVVTSLANGIDFLTNKLKLFGTIGLGAGLFAGINNVGIFRTITDEATGATNAIGLFGNSLADIKRNIKTGQGIRYSLFDGKSFTEKDITAIKNYANALDNGSTRAQAFNNNLKGCSVAAKQYIVNSAKAGQSTKEMVAGLESQAIAAKASAVAMKAASIAANMIITVAIIQGIQLVVKGISKLNSEYANLEKQIEKIESKYNEQIQSIEKLNQKIKENNEQIEEINKLETPTYVDLQDLENLKTQNAILKENLELAERAKESNAKEAINKLEKEFNKDFVTNDAKLEKTKHNIYKNIKTSQEPSKLEQLLTLVDVFETLTSLKEQALKNGGTYTTESLPDFFRDFLGDSADITEIDYLIEANIGTLQSLNTDLLTKLNKLSEYDPNYESSYAKYLINLINETTKYLDFDTYINSTIEKAVASSDHAFDKIGETIKENIAKGIIKNESDLLSDEDAMKLVKYIAMEVYGASNDDTFKKAGSYIIKNLSDGIDTNYLAEKSLKSFEDIWNSSDFSDAKDKLLELAKAGTISAETIKSTEDYKSLIKDTGLTAEQATRKIMNLLSVQERLSAASNGIKSLENAYKEFKDEDIGFVTAATLESLPDVFKTLKTYDFSLFEQIVGDPKSGVDKIQQAFNDIATAYFVEQGTMNGLLEASESEVNSYIANLKQMGITNAEEVVANAQKSLKENGVLLSEAEKEYAKYLNNKEGYDVSYINSNLSKNGQLISQLGSAYKDDYNNWCELLKKKTEAYNQFVSAINKAQYNKLSSKNIASVEHAQEIVNESKGKVPKDLAKSQFGFTNKSLQNAVMGDAAARFGSSMQTISEYTSAEIKAAKEYIETVEQYNAVFDEINLDLTEANLNLNSGFNYISPSSSSSSSSSSDSSSNSDTSENFDWIERKIKKLTDALNDLKDSADDTYSTWANRSNALVNAINTTRQAIDLQQQAYNRYMQQAESVGLSSVYKNLVQNGALDISTISDENLKNTINQYKEWYDKAQDCLDTQRDLKNSLNELNSKKFDNIQSIFDFDKEKLEHSLTLLNNQIDKLEMKGLFANESYYNQMLQYTQKEINSLANERTQLASVMSSSGLSQDSEAWQNMYSTLLKIDEEMDDLNKDMIEFNNNIRDLNWEIFEYLEDSISRITDETEYFVSLFEDKKLFDDNGNFNKYANATVALHATAFDTYKQQAQDYLEEMRDLQRQVVAGAGKDVLEQYNKMVDAHQDAVLAANKEKQAILDLIEDGYKAQLEAIQKVIDKKKEQLNMEKNLYDYQKSITEKTKNIASLEKQQVSLADDDSEETMAKIQQIKVQLEEAKADLEETEYEQYLKDTQDMLDQLATDYENWMNDRLDNEDALLAEIVSEISSESSTIKATLNEVAKENGTTISTSLNTVFSTTSPFTTTLTNSINGVKNAVTGTTTAINNLLNKVASVTGTSVNGTNAGTRSTGTTNTTQNSSYSSNNSNSSNNNTNNSTNSSNSGLIAGIFISKSDNYPKSKLDKEHSIVDRLKYFNFDSSFSARGQYFSKLGGSGTYRGSSSQNTWLINQMKLKGYKKGTSHVPKKDNYLIQEDGQELIYDKSEGSFVIPQSSEPTIVPLNVGDMVFSNESVKRLYELASSGNFGGFANNLTPSINPIADNMKKMADSLQATNNISTSNEIHMDGDININLPGVTNYEQFRKELIGDNKFEKAIFTMIGNGMMGKSTIEKRKYVR